MAHLIFSISSGDFSRHIEQKNSKSAFINLIFCKVTHNKFHIRNGCYDLYSYTAVCLQKIIEENDETNSYKNR